MLSGCDNVCNSTAVEDCTGLCGGSYTDCSVYDIDGNGYSTVVIGNQEWFVQNLKTTKFKDGSIIENLYDEDDWINTTNTHYPSYSVYDSYNGNDDDAIENLMIYGRLYNWYAVSDDRGICPDGWHIPSTGDINSLIENIGGCLNLNSCNTISGKLKTTGTIENSNGLWYSPNAGATNESGFSAVPAGQRRAEGEYEGINYNANFWLSTSGTNNPSGYAWYVGLLHQDEQVRFDENAQGRGLSARCIKSVP